MKTKQNDKLYRKWYFWVSIIGVLILIAVILIFCLGGPSTTHKVTICTEMDYQGDIGPCIKEEEVEIVATPENQSGCPVGTEPVYDVVGGFVGIRFVGCAKSR